MRYLLFVLTLAAAALGGAAVAESVPGPDGRITACYTPGVANVRLVDDPATCAQFQASAVSWAQQGPAGPQGPAGQAGATGATGPEGPAGSVPDATADRLLVKVAADAKTLTRLRTQIRSFDINTLAQSKAAVTQAQLDQVAKMLETISRLMRASHETSQAVIRNIK